MKKNDHRFELPLHLDQQLLYRPAWKNCALTRFYLFSYLLQVLPVVDTTRRWLWLFQFDDVLLYSPSFRGLINIVIVVCFTKIAATKSTVKGVKRGINHYFVGWLNERKIIGLRSFLCFQIRTSLNAAPRKINTSNWWVSPKLKEPKWLQFLLKAIPRFRSFTEKCSKKDLKKLSS